MNYKKNIEARISGDPAEQERRKAILNEIMSAFEKGGTEAVEAALTRKVSDIEKRFHRGLDEIRQKL
jgi:hypothetical protein